MLLRFPRCRAVSRRVKPYVMDKNQLIVFENIKKRFGHSLVLEDISFQLNQGEIFGLFRFKRGGVKPP